MAATVLAAVVASSGCGEVGSSGATDDARPRVIATTGIVADLARQVAGDRARVDALVPDGADPHTYEPTLRDVRDVVYADVAFSNYLLLEEHALIKTLDANLRPGTPNVSLAEGAVKYAAELIPLVEDASLDTVWLGLRVRGAGTGLGADRSSAVDLTATGLAGPPGGQLVTYLTESFGNPEFYVNSFDGFDSSDHDQDSAELPVDAHSHMSWTFTRAGYYQLHMRARLRVDQNSAPVDLGQTVVTFAVGVDPHRSPLGPDAVVLGAGHADITADLDRRSMYLYADPEGSGELYQREYQPDHTVIEVPNRALHEVPAGASYRFLGAPGDKVFQLPQAVLGKHVHGEIDPHLWQDVKNAEAYVRLIRDTLSRVDPDGAAEYRTNAERFLARLDETDRYVAAAIAQIPPARRQLVTTHDAFAYLGRAYGLSIAGFVTPNPATEPSLADRRRLSETIRNLDVPAVFLEPNLASRSSTLTQVAAENHVEVCPIYGDAFDRDVTSYVAMMRFNAESLRTCLSR